MTRRTDLALIVGTVLGARLLFLALVPASAISIDILDWNVVARLLEQGRNPYNETPFLNWPPLWMQVVAALNWLSRGSGIPFPRVVQIFLSLADVAVATAVSSLLRDELGIRHATRLVVLGIALNPICILLACQHGNHDALVALWIVLALKMILRWDRDRDPVDWLAAAFFLGIGVLEKTVPIVLAPLLATGVGQLRTTTRALGLALLVGPATLGLSILYVLGPGPVSANVLAYRSAAGWFGFTGVLLELGQERLFGAWSAVFLLLLVTSGLVIGALGWRGKLAARDQMLGAFLLMACILTFGPGNGSQYIWWVMPPLIACHGLFGRSWRVVVAVAYVVAIASYVVRYALASTLGGFLVNGPNPSHALLSASAWVMSRRGAFYVTLPLFVAYLVVVIFGWRKLLEDVRPTRSPGPASPETGAADMGSPESTSH